MLLFACLLLSANAQFNIDPTTFHLTYDGLRMYSEYVTPVKLIDGKYYVGQVVHSSLVGLNDTILWPGIVFNKTENVVVKIEHYSVDKEHANCCVGLGWIGKPCQPRMCCGGKCCCHTNTLKSKKDNCLRVSCPRGNYNICCNPGFQASCECNRLPVCKCG